MKKNVLFILLLFLVFSLTGCYYSEHQPPKPGSFSMDMNFQPTPSLEGKTLQINYAKTTGDFALHKLANYFVEFLPNQQFAFYQVIGKENFGSGTYTYRVSSKNPREATVVFKNFKGIHVGKTLVMQLMYYSQDMGYLNAWYLNHKKTDYASGLFEVKSDKTK